MAFDVVPVQVEVPEGGEIVFRLIVPSGAQIIVPLPDGTRAGDSVEFELQPHQLAALPRSDVVAILDGRFHAEPGDGVWLHGEACDPKREGEENIHSRHLSIF